ncbi:MAG TPA: FecR domain-containing protein [Dongiaceae bacterium]|nr:FecR domain-containing protein [Dongiaceae bacterium]
MPDLPLNASRRKRLTDAGASGLIGEGGSNAIPTAIVVILAIMLAAFVIAPNQVDSALDRTLTTVAGNSTLPAQAWRSVATTFVSEEDEEDEQIASAVPSSSLTVLKPNESAVTTDAGRTVLTRGHDILELDPETAITVGESWTEDSTAIVKLLDGSVLVKAAKRTDGGTLSIEGTFLIATVKGTEFKVTTTDSGSAVSVFEGVVSVRSTTSNIAVDVTPGRTAVVSAATGATPVLGLTRAAGAVAAIDAANAGIVSNSNHHSR